MTYEEKQRLNELITKLAAHIKFPEQLMYDLIIEGQIVVKYTFNMQTGQFDTERIG
jgi:hypothetical protein